MPRLFSRRAITSALAVGLIGVAAVLAWGWYQTASPPPGSDGADPNLIARYKSALNAAIVQNWTRPETVPIGQRCKIVIRQVIGGTVVDAKVDPSCPYDALGRRSIEAAVLKADPLPYSGFESVFNRTLILTFEAADR